MSNETSGTDIRERPQDSDRVKSYHRTGRILSVAGYLVDLALLLDLAFQRMVSGAAKRGNALQPAPMARLADLPGPVRNHHAGRRSPVRIS